MPLIIIPYFLHFVNDIFENYKTFLYFPRTKKYKIIIFVGAIVNNMLTRC